MLATERGSVAFGVANTRNIFFSLPCSRCLGTLFNTTEIMLDAHVVDGFGSGYF